MDKDTVNFALAGGTLVAFGITVWAAVSKSRAVDLKLEIIDRQLTAHETAVGRMYSHMLPALTELSHTAARRSEVGLLARAVQRGGFEPYQSDLYQVLLPFAESSPYALEDQGWLSNTKLLTQQPRDRLAEVTAKSKLERNT